jgi:hypothetical protein
MIENELATAAWRKATASGGTGGDCVEVAPLTEFSRGKLLCHAKVTDGNGGSSTPFVAARRKTWTDRRAASTI